jgi:hypothetical protein
MGRKHRIVRSIALFGCVIAACSCKGRDEKEVVRRNLLRAQNLAQQRDERIAAQRITDPDGDLLPSTTTIAGVVMPRGFNPKFTLDHEWFYDGEYSFKRVLKYFEQRLDAVIDRPDSSSVVFQGAKTKGVSDMKPVRVKIFPVPGRVDWTRIQINAPKPLPDHFPTAEEIQKQLASRRENFE